MLKLGESQAAEMSWSLLLFGPLMQLQLVGGLTGLGQPGWLHSQGWLLVLAVGWELGQGTLQGLLGSSP